VRQSLGTNLYDRISTRPFLSTEEKTWISYQLLYAVAEVHSRSVCHGDIKTENVLLNSWDWVFLSDFGLKPAYLPEDNPADFSYYFDSSSRRICYLAPERFCASGDILFLSGKITTQMDIFSLGCTIAELFLEGTPLFTFAQLLRYRKGEFDPIMILEKIENDQIKVCALIIFTKGIDQAHDPSKSSR
jgi:phosphoinositide-3-kinase regulatory subunit 4